VIGTARVAGSMVREKVGLPTARCLEPRLSTCGIRSCSGGEVVTAVRSYLMIAGGE
jgi:hypothetical protein